MHDARRMQGVHADNFMKDIVARATVLIDDDRRFCTLTLCVAARRSVLRQACSGHIDVNCARVPAYALNVKIQYY